MRKSRSLPPILFIYCYFALFIRGYYFYLFQARHQAPLLPRGGGSRQSHTAAISSQMTIRHPRHPSNAERNTSTITPCPYIPTKTSSCIFLDVMYSPQLDSHRQSSVSSAHLLCSTYSAAACCPALRHASKVNEFAGNKSV